MALALTNTDTNVIGARAEFICTATFDSSYPTGGESFTAANAGLDTILHLTITPDITDTTGAYASYTVNWDKSADKLVVLGGAGATATELDEVADTTDLSALVVYIRAVGNIRNQ